MSAQEAILQISDSATDADMLYATGFWVGDPFIHLRIGRKKIAVLSDLEIDRGRKALRGFEIVPLSGLMQAAAKGAAAAPTLADAALALLRQRKIKRVLVPGGFRLEYGDFLRKRGVQVKTGPTPFYRSRLAKREDEVAKIREAQEATEGAMGAAIDALRRAEIRGESLALDGDVLTAEKLKEIVGTYLLARGFAAGPIIVAPGVQACDPHEVGFGPIAAHVPVVIDIFPRSMRTGYFGDMTRTVVRGRASAKAKKMFDAVLEGQEIAFRMIRAGAAGQKIHAAITKRFEELGFPTGEIDGRMQGFFHGTGHALGLEIHEPPRIGKMRATLKTGMVMTVEPGLYYLDTGGMRIEDIVVVTKTGCTNLNRFPKFLEV